MQPVILKKIKNISALDHIKWKSSQREKTLLYCQYLLLLQRKTIYDGKIINFYDFIKGETDIIDQLSNYYTT